MHTTSLAIIKESAAMYKAGTPTDPMSLQDLTQIVGRLGNSKPTDTLEKNGMSSAILIAFSVSPKGTLNSTVAEKTSSVFNRLSIPGHRSKFLHVVISWELSDLTVYRNLKEVYGHQQKDLRARKYAMIRDTTDGLAEYVALMKGLEGVFVATDLRIIKDAVMNMLLVIFITHDMRYKFQNEMICATLRCFEYLAVTDFGINHPSSQNYIELVLKELFSGFERIRILALHARDRSADDELMRLLQLVPDLNPQTSWIVQIFDHFKHANTQDFMEGLVGASSSSSDKKKAGGKTEEEKKESWAQKNRDKKAAKKARNEQAAKQINTDNQPRLDPMLDHGVCSFYNTAKGCNRRDGECRRNHIVPRRNSNGWRKLSEYFKDKNISPCKEFLEAK